MKIAVIGAGICGLSAAKALCKRGHSVTLYEQFQLFHDRGSSHGASRIVRRAYPDAFYTACMAKAYPLWSQLEIESGAGLLHECGLLYFGSKSSPNLKSVSDSLAALSIPFEILDSSQVISKCPQLRLGKDELAVWTPEAGWVNAAAALRAMFDVASGYGLMVEVESQADPWSLAKENDVAIVAAGAWTTKFLPIPVKVTKQTYAYVDARVEGPVWIEDSADNPYGFPSDAHGLKLGIHRPGEAIDPSTSSREPSIEMLDLIRETASRRFGIREPLLKDPTTCLYTTTKSEDFLLGNLSPNIFFASACSGHGFKMGPWIGQLLADFAEGVDAPQNHPRFYFEV